MQKLIFPLVFLSASYLLSAQPYEDKVEYNKKKQACLVMDYNYPAEAVENALKLKMDQLGYKGKDEKGLFNKDKGFRIYNEAAISDISPDRYDYMVNIERKSRKKDNESVLYFLIMRNDENILPKLNTKELGNAKTFLINMIPDIEVANLELQITAQEDAVSKAEKKFKSLKGDKADMEQKIRKLQDDIKDNEKEQDFQQKEIENLKKILDELRAKRRN